MGGSRSSGFSAVRRDTDGSAELREKGMLANRIASYPDTEAEWLTIQFGPVGDRPTLYVESTARSSLALDQMNGIGDARYHELLLTEGMI
jgi:hypothetical protein